MNMPGEIFKRTQGVGSQDKAPISGALPKGFQNLEEYEKKIRELEARNKALEEKYGANQAVLDDEHDFFWERVGEVAKEGGSKDSEDAAVSAAPSAPLTPIDSTLRSVESPVEISDPVEQMRVAYAKDRGFIGNSSDRSIPSPSKIENPRLEDFKKRRLIIINLLEKEKAGSGDRETISLLEMQLEEIEKHIALEEKETSPVLQKESKIIPVFEDIVPAPTLEDKASDPAPSFEDNREDLSDDEEEAPSPAPAPAPAPEDQPEDDDEEDETPPPPRPPRVEGPSDYTLNKLHELGIDYQALVGQVPNFALMSDGQQAYILHKAQEAGIEKIESLAQSRFEADKKSKGWFTRTFRKGSIRREAIKNTAKDYKGLQSFADDIATLTSHVTENKRDITIEQDGSYRIEYIQVPQGLDAGDAFRIRCENYNRAATAFSDVPYEWGLKTATAQQRKIFEQAQKELAKHEKNVMEMYRNIGAEEGTVLMDANLLRGDIEIDRLLSSYPDARKQMDHMKNLTWKNQMTQGFRDAITAENGGKMAILGSGAVARIISKSLYGLGGAVGVGAIIGGILGVRKKNEQFRQDAIQARRDGGRKKTTDSVFDATANVNRIEKLLVQLEKVEATGDEERKERVLEALQDRLQLLDTRLKEGRINFGKPKDSLTNKHQLIQAMAHAAVYHEQAKEEHRQISGRVEGYFGGKDKEVRGERRQARVKGALVGATVGATVATAAWMIADYFMGDDVGKSVEKMVSTPAREIVPVDPGVDGPSPYNPIDFDVSVDASPKGAIQMYADLQDAIEQKYNGDYTNAPQYIQEFMSKTPTELAIEDNMYRPGEVNESAKIYKGGKLGFNKFGERVYTDARTGVDILSGDGKFDGGHFDYGAKSASGASLQGEGGGAGTGGGDASSSQFETRGVPSDASTGGTTGGAEDAEFRRMGRGVYGADIENTARDTASSNIGSPLYESALDENLPAEAHKLYINNSPVNYTIENDAKGNPFFKFYNTNPDNMGAYHRSYLAYRGSLDQYARDIVNSPKFERFGLNYSPEKVATDLKTNLNALILRDQMLESGGFNPSSEEYQVLTKERDQLFKSLRRFEKFTGESLLKGNWDRLDHIADPNFVPKGDTIFSLQNQPNPDMLPDIETKTDFVKVPDSNTTRGLVFEVTRDDAGEIIEMKPSGQVNRGGISLEQKLGFNPNWRTEAGLPLTFESEPQGQKIKSSLDLLRNTVAYRDAFPSNTEEYNFWNKIIQKQVQALDTKYPSMFQ